jgi:signal transduction histidine kinase
MLKVIVALSGWIILGLYLSYEYKEYGLGLFRHLFTRQEHPIQFIFHSIIVFAPLISTYVGYLMRQKENLLKELLKKEKLESMSTMSSSLAHDFVRLLSEVSRNLSRAKELSDDPEELCKRLEEAEKASASARELAQELLTFSKGIKPAKKISIVEDLVKEASESALQGTGVTSTYELSANLWPAHVDEGKMRQALSTVIKYSAEDVSQGGTILIKCENSSLGSQSGLPVKKGDYVKITIRDWGGGISEERLQRIFDPYSADSRASVGLGMASVFSIIEQNEGHIKAESEMGVSTTFHVYLPAPITVKEN